MELIPSGAPRNLTASRAKQLLATVRPRDVAGKARRQLAADYIDDVATLDRKLKTIQARITEAVEATGTTLTRVIGVGPVTAATILGEVGNIARFPSNDHFASYTGTAPLDASSGDIVRHRLSRAGNRQLNHALHMIAIAHRRFDPRGRAYYARKLAAGKGSKGAMRCLKRRLSDVVFRHLVDAAARSPGGQTGASLQSSATDPIPMAGTSEQPLPGLTTNPTLVATAMS
jgi:transposase